MKRNSNSVKRIHEQINGSPGTDRLLAKQRTIMHEDLMNHNFDTIFNTKLAILIATISWASLQAPALCHSSDSNEAQAQQNCKQIPKSAEKAQAEKKNGKGATWCTARTTIKASPEEVWKAVHDERQNDPDIAYSKILEQGENQYKLEQKFCLIPVLGTSVCVTHHVEVPNERIDYKLLHSDHFKAMEGSWVLSSLDGGKATQLELSSHLDLGLPVPKMLMDSITSKKMEKRLSHIKKMAESRHSALAAKGTRPIE